ncbi:NUDIX pyrophosphatase [Thermoplasma sp.]|uniref:NUDIX hydrolase n=1 Tax=Thermoplasma sp. TaxID=1973142 RepID=UPI00127FB407|nr:NUDIX pyrophosphatase [Thermoplasma sp.]KAA8922709.1 MAG: NUDIX pyrophosphatase [Thermoplasma sp.]
MVSTRTGLKIQAVIYRCNDGPEFLILHRNTEHGDFWQNVTGNVEPGEDLKVALMREIREEAGIGEDCIDHVTDDVTAFRFRAHDMNFTEHVYAVRIRDSCSIDITRNVDHEHDRYEWVNMDEAVRKVRWYTNADAIRISYIVASSACASLSQPSDKKN